MIATTRHTAAFGPITYYMTPRGTYMEIKPNGRKAQLSTKKRDALNLVTVDAIHTPATVETPAVETPAPVTPFEFDWWQYLGIAKPTVTANHERLSERRGCKTEKMVQTYTFRSGQEIINAMETHLITRIEGRTAYENLASKVAYSLLNAPFMSDIVSGMTDTAAVGGKYGQLAVCAKIGTAIVSPIMIPSDHSMFYAPDVFGCVNDPAAPYGALAFQWSKTADKNTVGIRTMSGICYVKTNKNGRPVPVKQHVKKFVSPLLSICAAAAYQILGTAPTVLNMPKLTFTTVKGTEVTAI